MRTENGKNSKYLKQTNRLLVLKLLCTEGSLLRNDLVRFTGLTKMTASNIVSDLTDTGWITESAVQESVHHSAGRKPAVLTLCDTSPCCAGIYVGRHSVRIAICDLAANALYTDESFYPESPDGQYVADLASSLLKKAKKQTRRKLIGVGISAIGPLDAEKGILLTPPNFFGMRNIPIQKMIESQIHMPCFLVHDSSAGALAEKLYGVGKDLSNFLFILISNGIGAGLIADNELYDGVLGLTGELGHISIRYDGPKCSCGGRGCLELYASEKNMADEIRKTDSSFSMPSRNTRDRATSEAAQSGKTGAMAALRHFCEICPFWLVNCININRIHMNRRLQRNDILKTFWKNESQ